MILRSLLIVATPYACRYSATQVQHKWHVPKRIRDDHESCYCAQGCDLCVCVCVHVCVCVCAWIYMYTCTRTHTHRCIHTRTNILTGHTLTSHELFIWGMLQFTHKTMYVYIYIHTRTRIYIYIYTYVCIYNHMYIYSYILAHTRTDVYTLAQIYSKSCDVCRNSHLKTCRI